MGDEISNEKWFLWVNTVNFHSLILMFMMINFNFALPQAFLQKINNIIIKIINLSKANTISLSPFYLDLDSSVSNGIGSMTLFPYPGHQTSLWTSEVQNLKHDSNMYILFTFFPSENSSHIYTISTQMSPFTSTAKVS